MHYVHVTGGVVDNRIVFDTAMPDTWPDYANWHANETAQIGWTYDGTTFTAPPPPEPEPPPPPQAETVVLFDHENRLRAQEGTPPLTLEDFQTRMNNPK